MIVEMVMPRMGEGIIECTILSILKKVGERISADDSVLEVATDKVDTEVPAPSGGVIKEILVKVNDVIPIGSVVMKIESGDNSLTNSTIEQPENIEIVAHKIEQEIVAIQPIVPSKMITNGSRFYSPLVKTIAQTEGITADELEQIQGTGTDGRVTKQDILGYLPNRLKKNGFIPSFGEGQKGTTMSRVRKMIAERMVESKRISAHVTSYVECDMTKVVNWRNGIKDKFRQETGENLTFTPFLVQAIVKAIQDFPNINISVDGDTIIQKPDINIGMAVALPDGNLIVPVIHNADKYDLAGLAKKVNDLATRARENKLTAKDVSGGTYTISNIGTFRNLMGTPIIMQPQVGIMAFGMIQKRPVVIEHPDGDFIGIRSMMYLSHSYDHRVVDGALGGMFAKCVAEFLENYTN